MCKLLLILLCLVSLLGCSTNNLTINDLGTNFKEENGVLTYTEENIDKIVIDATYLAELLEKQDNKENQQFVLNAIELVEQKLEHKKTELNKQQQEAMDNLNRVTDELNKAAN